MKLTKHIKFGLFLLAITAFMSAPVLAQEEGADAGTEKEGSRFNTWSAGIHLGHIKGYTDISQYDYYPVFKYQNENKIGFGVHITKAISNAIAIQGKFTYGSIQGTNRNQQFVSSGTYINGGIYHNTSVLTYGVNALINLSALSFKPKAAGAKDRKTAIYLLAGHGLIHFNSTSYRLVDDAEINSYGDGISGKTTEANNPFGGGIKYKMNNQIDLQMEITMNRVNSDKLDGWVLGSSKDYWHYISLGANYKFGSAGGEAESLEWVNPMETMYKDLQENKARLTGLEADDDGDGVSNFFDKEAGTEEGMSVNGQGAATDIDGDGVPDSRDEDNFTDKGAAVDEKGKALDSDGDGVPDSRDLDASTEAGQLVNFQGKPIAAPKSTGGGGGGAGGGAAYLPSVYFNTNSRTVTYANYDRLATIARAMKANPNSKITLIGHTDKTGSDEYNVKLGEQRAQAVADHLTKHYGVGADRISIESKGKSEPLAEGLNHINRRVDVNVK